MKRECVILLIGLGFLTSCFEEEIEKDMSVKEIFWHFLSDSNPYAFLGSKLVARYDAKPTGVIVDANGMVQQLTDLSGNGHHLIQSTAANRPPWDFENRITFQFSTQQFLINNSLIAAMTSSSIGVYGIFQSTSSDVFVVNFCDTDGTAFCGLRNGATLSWGGTLNAGASGIAMNRDNLQQLFGMQVNRNVNLNVMEDTTITNVVDTLTSVFTDYTTVDNFCMGARILATPAYLNYFFESLVITNGQLTAGELSQLATQLTADQRTYDKILVAELGQSNMEGRDGDLTHPRYPFTTNTGKYWNGSAENFILTTRDGASSNRGSHANYFCEKYFSLRGVQPVMIECATGGTGLTATASATNWSAGSTLRGTTETKITSALTNYSRANPDFILWAQGETDAQTMDSNGAYTKAIVKAAMQDVIDWLQTTYVGVPIIISELGYLNSGVAETQGWTDMRAIQNEIVAENTGVYIGWDGAKDLTVGQMYDIFHYTYEGYKLMGEGLATYIAENF